MQCVEFNNRLDELIDRGIDWQADPALLEHTSQCPACRELASAYQGMLLGVQSLERLRPSPELPAQILSAWKQGPSPERPAAVGLPSHPTWSWVYVATPMVAIAATLVVAALAWQLRTTVVPDLASPEIVQQPREPALPQTSEVATQLPQTEDPASEEERPLRNLAREASRKYWTLAAATQAGVYDALLIVPGVQPTAAESQAVPRGNGETVSTTTTARASWVQEVTSGLTAITDTTAGTLDVLWQAIPAAGEDHRS